MKKILFIVSMLGLAILSHSCMKERAASNASDMSVSGTDAVTITVRAQAPQTDPAPSEEATRTYLDTYTDAQSVEHPYTVLWKTGDRMRLFVTPDGGTPVGYLSSALTADDNGKPTASFSFTVSPLPAEASSYLYQGIHPASAAVSSDNADLTRYKVVLPAVQTTSGTAYDPDAYILLAVPQSFSGVADWESASFTRAVALNELTLRGLPEGVNRVEIVAPDGVYLAGGREFDLTGGTAGSVYAGTGTVEVNFSPALSAGDQVIRFTSWGATIPVGGTLTVLAYTSTKSYTKSIPIPSGHPISLTEGKLNTLTVDMDASLAAVVEADRYFSGGNGTQVSPWRIASKTDLSNLATYIADKEDAAMLALRDDYYLQTADIDFANGYLDAIGNTNDSSPYSYFTGTYDGNGYEIANVIIRNQQSNKAVGFFGYLDGAAHIKGMTLRNASITSTTWNNGIIAGCVQSSSTALIEDCVVTGSSVSGNNTGNGGLVGRLMKGTIRNCSYDGTVTGTGSGKGKCGGIVGETAASGTLIQNCTFSGTVTSPDAYAGGVLGWSGGGSSASILSCIEGCSVSDATVSAVTGMAGGILGGCDKYTVVNRCTASCTVSNTGTGSYGHLGGIVGDITTNNVLVANCRFDAGTLSNDNGTAGDVAGVVGRFSAPTMDNATIFNCCSFPTNVSTGGSSNANLSGVGGFVNTVTIRNCYSPAVKSVFLYNNTADGSGSRGSIYGWLRGVNTSDACSGKLLDVYWLSGWKAGNYSGSYKYVKSEQALTDAQMRNTGPVTRPSTGVAYGCFIDALNADVAAWNASSPLFGIQGVTWEMGSNGYPVPAIN